MVERAAFAGGALPLATVGAFGVLSYTVTQQAPEFGIRMALGASAQRVLWLVMGRGMVPVAVGVALGVGGALALSRFVGGLLFDHMAVGSRCFGEVEGEEGDVTEAGVGGDDTM